MFKHKCNEVSSFQNKNVFNSKAVAKNIKSI